MLRCENLSVARGGFALLDRVTFALAPGDILVLRGPNGIGKTTLLRTLAGLQPPLAGEVSAAEETVSYAGHLDAVKATLSVLENLSFWAEIHGHTDIETPLETFALADLAHRAAGTLSAGQRRRLGLARLLVTGRPIWALDEPTVSLDTASVTAFQAALKSHLSTGGAAIIATHIDLGLEARVLDLTAHRAALKLTPAEDAFL